MEPNELPLPPDFVPPPQAQAAVPVVTGAPPIPSNVQAQQPAQPSMLERLREQVMQDVMPGRYETMQARARAFGAGMLGSGGNFFQGLAAGQQAMDQQRAQEQAARANRLKAAEEETLQRARLQLEEAKQRFDQDPTNWRARADLMRAEAAMRQAEAAMGRNAIDRRARWQILPGEEGQPPVFVNMNDPTQRMPATGLSLPRDPQMEATARIRATAAAEAEVKRLSDSGQLNTRDPGAVQRAWQAAYDRALAGNRPPSSGAPSSGGGEVRPPSIPRYDYTPAPTR